MQLSTVRPADVEWVARAIDSWDCSSRWSLRGQTPSPEQMQRLLWDQVYLQKALRTDAGAAAGLLQLVDLDLHDGIGRLGLLLDRARMTSLAPGVEDFLRLSFRNFPLRKICVVAPCDAFDAPGWFGPQLRCVGTFAAHERRGRDTYADVAIHEIWRDGVAQGL